VLQAARALRPGYSSEEEAHNLDMGRPQLLPHLSHALGWNGHPGMLGLRRCGDSVGERSAFCAAALPWHGRGDVLLRP
jgi:hypothetical protein